MESHVPPTSGAAISDMDDEEESPFLPQADNKATVANFLAEAEISNLIQGLFYRNKKDSTPHLHPHRQPLPQAQELSLGSH
jgi:hypothetical protein